ncbi:MAG: hypothetical protein WCQ47_07565 [bacterium]
MSYLLSVFIILQLLCFNAYSQSEEELDKLLEEVKDLPNQPSELYSIISETGAINNVPAEDSNFLKKEEALYTPITPIRKGPSSRNYYLLEKENPKSKFDKNGFLKSRYETINKINELEKRKDAYYGGTVCLGNEPSLLGKIYGSGKASGLLSTGDELEIEFSSYRPCNTGEKYVSMDKDSIGVYKITGVLEIMEKGAREKSCIAKVRTNYDMIKRGAFVSSPITFESSAIEISAQAQSGKIYKIHSQMEIAGAGDRLCVLFKNQLAPKAGTVVYFYDVKDPLTGNEIKPYLVAKGKLIYSYSSYGTALIMSANRPITKDLAVTTRF